MRIYKQSDSIASDLRILFLKEFHFCDPLDSTPVQGVEPFPKNCNCD